VEQQGAVSRATVTVTEFRKRNVRGKERLSPPSSRPSKLSFRHDHDPLRRKRTVTSVVLRTYGKSSKTSLSYPTSSAPRHDRHLSVAVVSDCRVTFSPPGRLDNATCSVTAVSGPYQQLRAVCPWFAASLTAFTGFLVHVVFCLVVSISTSVSTRPHSPPGFHVYRLFALSKCLVSIAETVTQTDQYTLNPGLHVGWVV
jgi:hypothetical protein